MIPEHSMVVVADPFLNAGIFDSRSGEQLARFPVKLDRFAASPDGKYLAFVDETATLGVWQFGPKKSPSD